MTGVEFTLLLIAVLIGASGPIILKFILSGLLFKEVTNKAPIVKLVDSPVAKMEQRYDSSAFEKLKDAYTAEINGTIDRMRCLHTYGELVRPLEYHKTAKTSESKWRCSYCDRSVKFDNDECPGCGAQKE
jgi:hypothetical protein